MAKCLPASKLNLLVQIAMEKPRFFLLDLASIFHFKKLWSNRSGIDFKGILWDQVLTIGSRMNVFGVVELLCEFFQILGFKVSR